MDILEILSKAGGIVLPTALVILFGLIKIPKLEINIWKWLGKAIGKSINEEVMKRIGDMETKLDTFSDELTSIKENNKHQDERYEKDRALSARRRIIQFADEIRRKIDHSQEGFNIVLKDITFYSNYCDTHPGFKNDQAKASIKIIDDVYAECLKEDKFL